MSLYPSLSTLCPRLAILRVHSHGMVTIDLQCYEDDDVAQLDNVGNFIFFCLFVSKQNTTHKCRHATRHNETYFLWLFISLYLFPGNMWQEEGCVINADGMLWPCNNHSVSHKERQECQKSRQDELHCSSVFNCLYPKQGLDHSDNHNYFKWYCIPDH